MKNLRLGTKLSVVFAIAISALIGLGMFSIVKLGTMADKVTYMGVDQRNKQIAISDIDIATADFRIYESIHILSKTPGEMGVAQEKMDKASKIIADNLAFLDANLKAPHARQAVKKFEGNWAKFMRHAPATLALSEQNRADEALASMKAEQAVFNAANSAAASLSDAQTQNAKDVLQAAIGTYENARLLTILLTVLVVGLLCMLLLVLIKSIAKPIAAITQAISDLSHGKMDVAVPTEARRDEVGDLATAMADLRDKLAAAEREKAEQVELIVDSIGGGLEALSQGDLTVRIDAELTGAFAKLKTDFNNAMSAMSTAMSAVSTATSGINSGASDIRQASDDLSQRTEQQAASLEQTAAAMDEITATVRQTAEGANRANSVVGEARVEAEHSGDVVRRAVDAMSGIEKSSAEISEIISVIDGIAFQTNLLALNAGVEAARAGDAGKGFAVVASEVRALAQRSAEAAKDVKTRITASSEQVDMGVELVSETGKALGRIIGRIGEISTLVSAIADSADQQATGLQQINTAVSEMDGVTQQNAAMVEQATAAARSLAVEADALAREVARFQMSAPEQRGTAQHGGSRQTPVVHQLQDRAIEAGRRLGRATRTKGSAAVALADDDWSEF